MKSNSLSLTFLLLLFCCCCFTTSIQAQFNDAEGVAPIIPTTEILFDEMEYDFGTLTSGEKVSQIFTFKNTGDVPLIISNAKGSCGCTVPAWPKEPIMPGEVATIEASFNSKNKRGKRNQKITITANTEPAQTFLYLVGEVLPAEGDESITIETFDINNEPEKIDLQSLNCIAVYPNPTADIVKLEISENMGKKALVRIFSKSGQLMAERPIESISGTIEFEVSHYPGGTYYANVQIEGQEPVSHCFLVSK